MQIGPQQKDTSYESIAASRGIFNKCTISELALKIPIGLQQNVLMATPMAGHLSQFDRSNISLGTGPTGATGPTGPVGTPGSQTNTGATGSISNSTGPTGPTGIPGSLTNTGASGSTGTIGPSGPTGYPGWLTKTGSTGPIGTTGPSGPTGAPGTSVNTGASGATGETGQSGPTGLHGSQTNTGPTGPTGRADGPTGPTGSTGRPGGQTGATGPESPVGLVSYSRVLLSSQYYDISPNSNTYQLINGVPAGIVRIGLPPSTTETVGKYYVLANNTEQLIFIYATLPYSWAGTGNGNFVEVDNVDQSPIINADPFFTRVATYSYQSLFPEVERMLSPWFTVSKTLELTGQRTYSVLRNPGYSQSLFQAELGSLWIDLGLTGTANPLVSVDIFSDPVPLILIAPGRTGAFVNNGVIGNWQVAGNA